MICKAFSLQLNGGTAKTAEIRDAFVRAHAQRARVRDGRQTALEAFTVEALRMMRN
jgi:hypothetical protein